MWEFSINSENVYLTENIFISSHFLVLRIKIDSVVSVGCTPAASFVSVMCDS